MVPGVCIFVDFLFEIALLVLITNNSNDRVMKKTVLFAGLLLYAATMCAQFDGAVGTEGCRAVGISDSRIQSWAFGVRVKKGFTSPNGTTKVSYGTPDMAQGVPDGTTTTAISLGYGGEALITFDRPIYDGAGADFAVFENGYGSTFLELAFVEVSSDGEHFFRFAATSLSSGTNDVQAQYYNNLAGKYEVGYGTPFDLSDLEDDALLDKNNIRFVRLIDVNEGVDTDAQGNVIYDSPGAGSYSAGFDLTGVAVLNGLTPYVISSAEGLLEGSDTHQLVDMDNAIVDENGDYTAAFTDGDLVYEALGLYGGMFQIGFGLSNHTTTAGYYSSASLRAQDGAGSTYMVAYYSDYAGTQEHNVIRKADNGEFYPQGVYVAPSSAMYDYVTGSSFPSDGYLSITATGYDAQGIRTGASTLYFVDLRATTTATEAVDDWVYLDLLPLGGCTKIVFTLASNDDSGWGMNPPAYFCTDALTYRSDNAPIEIPVSLMTLAAKEISSTSAVLNARIDYGTNGSEIFSVGFEYKTAASPDWIRETVQAASAEYSLILTELIANTQYEFRAFAEDNSGERIYGEVLGFTTLQDGALSIAHPFGFAVYPNPAKEGVNLDIASGDARVLIYDMQSRELYSENVNGSCNISFSLPSGMYLFVVEKDGVRNAKRLIVR